MPDERWLELECDDGSTMRAFTVRPAGPLAAPRGGVMVLQEAFGVNANLRGIAARFAALGFVAIAPELFHRTAPGFDGRYDDFPAAMVHIRQLTPEGLLSDARAAHDWLLQYGGVPAARTAAVGFCMGGRAAWLANSALPLGASVSYYGGAIAPALLDRAPRLHGPQLFFWGGEDPSIPPEQHRAVVDALRAAGRPFASVEFSDAPHGFFNDEGPRYRETAARESWAMMVAFLEDRLTTYKP